MNSQNDLVDCIHKHLNTASRHDRTVHPRPFFVEFSGTPSSGKTTAITELDKYLRRQNLRVWRPQEGAEVIRHMPRGGPLYNIRTVLYVIEIIIDQSQNAVYDVILLDRGVFDAMIWVTYWYNKGGMPKVEHDIVLRFLDLPYWVECVDCAFMMVCDPLEAVQRDLRIAHTKKEGPSTNGDNLATLIQLYKKTYEELRDRHLRIHMVDTTSLSEADMVQQIIHTTTEELVATTRAG